MRAVISNPVRQPLIKAGVLPKAVELPDLFGTNFPSYFASAKYGWCEILLPGINSPSFFGCCHIRWAGKACLAQTLHPFIGIDKTDGMTDAKSPNGLHLRRKTIVSDGCFRQKCPNRLQPKRNSLSMDVGYNCNRALRTNTKGSVWSRKENLTAIAETEPLEDPVRSGKT